MADMHRRPRMYPPPPPPPGGRGHIPPHAMIRAPFVPMPQYGHPGMRDRGRYDPRDDRRYTDEFGRDMYPPREHRHRDDRGHGDSHRRDIGGDRRDDRRRDDRGDRRPPRRNPFNEERAFKGRSMDLANALSPHLQEGPMDIKEFWRITRDKRLERDPHAVMWAIIKLGEAELARQYLKTVHDAKDILNSPVPTKDRWLIHRAVWEGCIELITILIDYGVSSDRLNTWNESPFEVVDSCVEQKQYGQDQADLIKDLLRKANTAPPAPPPRRVEQTAKLPAAMPSMPNMPSQADMLTMQNMMLANMQMSMSGVMPYAAYGAWVPGSVAEDVTWITELRTSNDQTHVFVTEIAFEATADDVRELFAQAGEIEKFHMPVKNLGKKTESYQAVGVKLQQGLCHQGKAIIKYTSKDAVEKALSLTGAAIKGRQLLVTRSQKSAKKKKKEAMGQTEAERLLGQYAKKKRTPRPESKPVEKPAKGDDSWVEKLVAGPDQTHCYVNGIAFEATMAEVKRLFKKCGELIGFYMPEAKTSKKSQGYDSVIDKVGSTSTPHRGRAILLYRTIYDLRGALALNGYLLKGRNLIVTKARHTAKSAAKVAENAAKKMAGGRKRKRPEETQAEKDAADQVIPIDIDIETKAGTQQSEIEKAQAWTNRVMRQVNNKLAKDRERHSMTANHAVKRKAPGSAGAGDSSNDFMAMLLEHKRKQAAKKAKVAAAEETSKESESVKIGPASAPAAVPSVDGDNP